MGGGGDNTTTQIQEIPEQFRPYYDALFSSGLGAAATTAYGPQTQTPQGYAQQAPYWQGGPGKQGQGQGEGGGNQNFAMSPNKAAQQSQQPQAQPQAQAPPQALPQQTNQPAPYTPPTYQGFNQGGSKPGQQGQQGQQGQRGQPQQPQGQQYGQQPQGQPAAQQGQPQQPAPHPNPQALNASGYTGDPYGPQEGQIIGQPYQGQFLAPSTPQELQGSAMREQLGYQFQGIGNPMMQLGQDTAAGNYLNSNPYFDQALQQAMQPAIQNFTGNVVPQYNSMALNSGAFKGSSARDMGMNQLGGAFGRDLLGTAATMGYQNYANERNLQQNAGQLIDQGARLNQLAPEMMGQAGQGYRDAYQRYLDENLLQFQESQQAPFRPLMNLASIIQGTDIGQNVTNFGQQPSSFAGGITGALGGGALGMSMGNAAGLQGWQAAGAGMAGGAAGALAGAF